MKKIKNYFFIFVCFFSIISSVEAVYWGVTYREFGVNEESANLIGGKTYTMLPYGGFGVGAGGYLTLDPVENSTDYWWLKDDIYLQFVGIYIIKKIYIGGLFDIKLVPNVFYGSGNIFINRKYVYNGDIYSEDNSSFKIIEPGINVEMSLTDTIKIETGMSISSISNTDLNNYSDEDFNGMTFSFSIVIGSSPYGYSGGGSAIGALYPGSSAVESTRHKE